MKNQRLHALADHPHRCARIEVHRPRTQPDIRDTLNEISHERSGIALVHCRYRVECGAESMKFDHWHVLARGQRIASSLPDEFAVSEFLKGYGIMWPPPLPGFGEKGAVLQ